MLTLGSKTFFSGAIVALVCAIGVAFGTSDQATILLLVTASLALGLLGGAVLFGAGAADRFSYTGGEDLRPARDPQATITPFICALSAGGAVLGIALGAPYLLMGGASVAACLAAWFSESWKDHPDYHGVLTKRVSNYVSLPFGMPVALLAVIGLVAISVSRIFLAVTHTQAWVVAIVVALLVFVGAIVLAAAPKMSKRTTMAVAAVGTAMILGMGIYGIARGTHKSGEHGSEESGHSTGESGAVEGAHSADESGAEEGGHSAEDSAVASAEESAP